MFTAYVIDDADGTEKIWLFVELPEDVEFLPIVTELNRKPAIAALTTTGAVYEALPKGNWDMRGFVSRLPTTTQKALIPDGRNAFSKRPGEEATPITATHFDELLQQLQVKPCYAILRYV